MGVGYRKTEVEDAIINGLFPLSKAGGGYVMTLERYRGELSENKILQEALRMPAVFVAYAGSNYSQGPYLGVNETLSFNVIAVTRTGVSPDSCDVLEDVRAALCGSSLGLQISPIRLVREFPLGVTKQTTALSALYSVTQKVSLTAQPGA